MNFEPYDYQKEAIDFIRDRNQSALWLECGLGKTIITLTAINNMFKENTTRGALIVAPLRVARLTWETEIGKWEHTRWMKHVFLHGRNKGSKLRQKVQIFLINYEGLTWLFNEALYKYKRSTWPFDIIVFDEITKMKAHNTLRFRSVKNRVNAFKKRIGLTGTPVPNTYMDLWGQYYMLDQGDRLGKNFYGFKNRFFYPKDYRGFKWEIRPGHSRIIKEKVSDITLRIGAEGLLKMHEPLVRDIDVELPVNCRAGYKTLEKELFIKIDDIEVEAFNAATLTGKCLQFAGGAVYHNDEHEWIEVHRAKLEALKTLLLQHKNEPVLVIYNYKHEAQRIKECFPNSVYWKSGLSKKVERDILTRWDKGDIPILIGHPASLGHGLNLQYGGRIGIWFTLNWSLELYIQTNKRLDRQGQSQPPLFYRLITANTVDEVVAETLRAKDTRQTSILNALKLYRDGKNGK